MSIKRKKEIYNLLNLIMLQVLIIINFIVYIIYIIPKQLVKMNVMKLLDKLILKTPQDSIKKHKTGQ